MDQKKIKDKQRLDRIEKQLHVIGSVLVGILHDNGVHDLDPVLYKVGIATARTKPKSAIIQPNKELIKP